VKLLSDYPVNEPMEAADGCQYCSAIYSVTVLHDDAENQIGTIGYGLIHDPDCPERFEEFEDPYPGSPDYFKRWGPPDDYAWERAVDYYLKVHQSFSDIQDCQPLPLSQLEFPVLAE
jgi:hypothetical protein